MTFTEYLNSQYAVTDRLDSITGQQILPEDDSSACSGEGSAGTVSADIATVDNRVFDSDIVKRKDLDDKTNLAHLIKHLKILK
jgi:hypothetical protein